MTKSRWLFWAARGLASWGALVTLWGLWLLYEYGMHDRTIVAHGGPFGLLLLTVVILSLVLAVAVGEHGVSVLARETNEGANAISRNLMARADERMTEAEAVLSRTEAMQERTQEMLGQRPDPRPLSPRRMDDHG